PIRFHPPRLPLRSRFLAIRPRPPLFPRPESTKSDQKTIPPRARFARPPVARNSAALVRPKTPKPAANRATASADFRPERIPEDSKLHRHPDPVRRPRPYDRPIRNASPSTRPFLKRYPV